MQKTVSKSAFAELTSKPLRVAAYCRMFSDSNEPSLGLEAKQRYYTEKIESNPNWTVAGIFADEAFSGTPVKKRPEFLKMVRQCRQKKIDLILTESISCFSKSTVDCLNYIRKLRDMGVGVYFEQYDINTLDVDSELYITMYGAIARAESKSLSHMCHCTACFKGLSRYGKRNKPNWNKALSFIGRSEN